MPTSLHLQPCTSYGYYSDSLQASESAAAAAAAAVTDDDAHRLSCLTTYHCFRAVRLCLAHA